MGIAEQVRDVVAPLCAEAGVDLWDVEWAGGSVRVLVDRAGGLDLDEIATLTRSFSRALDEADPVQTHYTLEVSSPGLERLLRTADHYQRAIGATVQLKLVAGAADDADRRVRGVLEAVEGAESRSVAVIRVEGAAEPRRIPLSEVERARTVFEWGPGPRPGGSRPPSTKRKKAARS